MRTLSLHSQFPTNELIETYKEPQDFEIFSRPLLFFLLNYCSSITSYEDTLDAIAGLLIDFVSPELTLECMYVCCFMNNIEHFRIHYLNEKNEVVEDEELLNYLKQWHPQIVMLVDALLQEQFYIIETFLQNIQSDYSNFKKLTFDMEFLDSDSKEKFAYFYTYNERNYALGLAASGDIVVQAFRFFHEERHVFMHKNHTTWAFLDKVNISRKFWTYTCPLGLKFSFLSLKDVEPTLAAHIKKMDKIKHFHLFNEQDGLRNHLGDI